MIRRVVILSCALCFGSGALFPCGGPDTYAIDGPLVPSANYYWSLNSDYGMPTPPVELKFLYPFHLMYPKELADLYRFSYQNPEEYQQNPRDSVSLARRVDLKPLDGAIDGGDRAGASRAAQAITDRIIDMPAAQAQDNQAALKRAVEWLELAPTLAAEPTGKLRAALEERAQPLRQFDRTQAEQFAAAHPDSPRLPSVRFVVLQEAMKRDIPNGWREDILKKVSPDTWRRLEAMADEWLKAYPSHPLADLVRLQKLRLLYFQQDARRAWGLLLGMYPRRLPRVLGEMRYLLLAYLPPDSATLSDPKLDPLLKAAFSDQEARSLADWSALWDLSLQHAKEPWAVNLQERLLSLIAAARYGAGSNAEPMALPAGFPQQPNAPTPLWAELRLVSLLRADRLDDAMVQTRTLGDTGIAPLVRSKLHLIRKQWVEAVTVPGLDSATQRYLIRVLAPNEALVTLGQAKDARVRQEAGLELAVRTAAESGWSRGAGQLEATDRDRAGRWRQASALAADSSSAGRLAYARFLAGHSGGLFFGRDRAWSRSLEYRRMAVGSPTASSLDTRLPWTAQEEIALIDRYFMTSFEDYLALQAYAALLSGVPPQDPNAAVALKEADQLYNALLKAPYWGNYLPKGKEAEAIRRAGKAIHNR